MGSSCSSNGKHPNDSDITTPSNGSVSNGGGIKRKANNDQPTSSQRYGAPETTVTKGGLSSTSISFVDIDDGGKKSPRSVRIFGDDNQHSYASHISIEILGDMNGSGSGTPRKKDGSRANLHGSTFSDAKGPSSFLGTSRSMSAHLQHFVKKMQGGEGMTVEEVDFICEVMRYGSGYVNAFTMSQTVDPAVLQYLQSKQEAQLIFPVQECRPVGADSSLDVLEQYPSISDARFIRAESLHGVRRESREISHTNSIHLRHRQSTTSVGSVESSEASSNGMEAVSVNDPELAKRIQEGNKLVQRTWNEAYATPGFAIRLLERQRANNPALADSVFYKTNQAKLADKLGGMINDSIQMLDKPDAFIPVMMQLGVKHIMYGVGDEHLDMFRDALFSILKELMQPPRTKWDEALAKEWKRAFALMKSMMTQGRITPQGLKETRRHDAQTHRMLLRCWKSVADREDTGLETSFVELLHVEGGKVVGSERYDLFANLVARRRMFMDMMTKLFEVGLKDSEAIHLLRELGARHVSYGLTKDDYVAYTDPFVKTVVECARPSTINPLVKHLLREFWQRATSIMIEGSVESRCGFTLRQAPKGTPFAIVFTDIEGSTALWENQPIAMERAVDEHHKLVRDLIHDHNGYEVKTIGDSFMIAFKGLADAVTMALRLQVELLRASVEGLQIDGTRCEASGPPEVWNPSAVRVRVGVHWCTDATPKFDVVYKRYDYYGNDVNVASRVQDAACGGQVMCTDSTLKALQALAGPMHEETFTAAKLQTLASSNIEKNAKASLNDVLQTTMYLAKAELKGVNEPLTLHSLYPKVLEGRAYGKRNKDVFNE